MLKIYRRLQPGPHPEIEMSRFLVERAGFANTPPLLAFMELDLDGDGPQTHALGVLFGFVRNQGDGWTQALDYLTRYLDDALSSRHSTRRTCPIPMCFSFRWRASSGFALPRCIELWPRGAVMIPTLLPNR